jgi:starch synthase
LEKISDSTPILGIVSRFVPQKGIDFVGEIAGRLSDRDLALVVLGTGEARYERFFRDWAFWHKTNVAVQIRYDDALAHKIEAGSDIFLMPSRYEPCGLNQIYSLRYGTVPVVRATGGLDDTIQSFDHQTNQGTGFKFYPYEGSALLGSIREALRTFRDAKAWQALQKNGMAKDFSWKASAASYVMLYEAAKRSRIPKAVTTSKA